MKRSPALLLLYGILLTIFLTCLLWFFVGLATKQCREGYIMDYRSGICVSGYRP